MIGSTRWIFKKKLVAPVHKGFIVFSDQKLGPYHLSPGCQVTYHGLWNFCIGAERWMSIKEVFYCSFSNLGHWRWPDHGIKPACRILALGALGLRYEDVFECPPPSSSIWCYLVITQPEWNPGMVSIYLYYPLLDGKAICGFSKCWEESPVEHGWPLMHK